jgi:hypothetical protein
VAQSIRRGHGCSIVADVFALVTKVHALPIGRLMFDACKYRVSGIVELLRHCGVNRAFGVGFPARCPGSSSLLRMASSTKRESAAGAALGAQRGRTAPPCDRALWVSDSTAQSW